MGKPNLRLIPGTPNPEAVKCALDLLEGVYSGRVTGFAIAVHLRDGGYFVDVIGSATKCLAHTRGMVAALDDEVCRQVQEEADTSPDFEW